VALVSRSPKTSTRWDKIEIQTARTTDSQARRRREGRLTRAKGEIEDKVHRARSVLRVAELFDGGEEVRRFGEHPVRRRPQGDDTCQIPTASRTRTACLPVLEK